MGVEGAEDLDVALVGGFFEAKGVAHSGRIASFVVQKDGFDGAGEATVTTVGDSVTGVAIAEGEGDALGVGIGGITRDEALDEALGDEGSGGLVTVDLIEVAVGAEVACEPVEGLFHVEIADNDLVISSGVVVVGRTISLEGAGPVCHCGVVDEFAAENRFGADVVVGAEHLHGVIEGVIDVAITRSGREGVVASVIGRIVPVLVFRTAIAVGAPAVAVTGDDAGKLGDVVVGVGSLRETVAGVQG